MKKILFLLLFAAVPASAKDIWRSTSPVVNLTQAVLCGGGRGGTLYGVTVSSAVAQSGVTIYNSSFTTTQGTGFISNSTWGFVPYLTNYTKGLSYTKTGTANITIIYDCY